MNKKKILIIDNSLYPTGALRSILNVITLLEDDFSFCFAISGQSKVGDALAARGYKVFRIPFLEISKSPVALLRYLPALFTNTRRLLKIIAQEGISLVHVNDLFNQSGTALKLMKPTLPVIYHVRLLASSYVGKLYGLFAGLIKRQADKLICVSGAVLEDVGPTSKAVIIYDGMEAQEQYPDWSGLNDPAAAHILYLGNIVRGKGQQWGILALAEAVKKFPQLHLEFAGGVNSRADEAFLKELQQLAADHGISDNISFTGQVRNVEQTIKGADLVLNMSESESFSLVCLEALLFGLPLIASDCGGPRDITDNGRMATLVPNKDAKAAAAAILEMLDNPEWTKKRALEAKSYAAQKYSLSKSAEQLRALYNQYKQSSSDDPASSS